MTKISALTITLVTSGFEIEMDSANPIEMAIRLDSRNAGTIESDRLR